MQVIAHSKLLTGDVVFGGGEAREGVAVVSALHTEMHSTVLGVADQDLEPGKRGTIVVAGVVVVNKHNQAPVQFGCIVTTAAAVKDMSLQLPIGTLIEDSVEGILRDGAYTSGMRIFLCPWMCALTIPVVYETTDERATKKVRTDDATIEHTVTRHVRTKVEPGRADLARMFGSKGYSAFLGALGLTEDSDDSDTIEQLQKAVYKARTTNETPQWCGVQ